MSDYTTIPSTGKLKLKGVKDARVDKKKKRKKATVEAEHEDSSVTEGKLRKEDDSTKYSKEKQLDSTATPDLDSTVPDEGEEVRERLKTDAEKRYDEQRKKRLEKRMEKEGVKTHKQRVEDLNRYLSNLSEHHDMPKIGPG